MIVLGFDTSTPSTSVAVRLADGQSTQLRDDPASGAHPGHATRLLAMAHELLAAAGAPWSAIDRIAVGVGPGTFTGLRVGVATARGLAQSLSVELVGVSSPLALAAAALERGAFDDGGRAAVLAVIDARRSEAFAAAYERADDGTPQELTVPRALPPHELVAPRALPPQQLHEVVAEAELAAGEALHWLAVGDGALRYRAELEAASLAVADESSPLHLLSAATICELGARASVSSMQEIVPDYRRRPDAELAFEGAASGKGP